MQSRAVFVNVVGPGRCMVPVFVNGRPFEPGYVKDDFRDLAGAEVNGPSEVSPASWRSWELRLGHEGAPPSPGRRGRGRHPPPEGGHQPMRRILLWADRDGEVFGEDCRVETEPRRER